ncbi:hypothetical protein OG455_01920 [Kitasatospora sp. NBC_01287]|uniref:hypothetical protein n=1 Tax=Kitasatospora sp. NBC_01287 TaxID=2903573 RepID=UPI00224DE9C2|nr:hypothetical protein [Kitasatospora sp. NBC_01287]MCX4744281.1 hypothetical protein [Kitasatospora sp. NBC_01287]
MAVAQLAVVADVVAELPSLAERIATGALAVDPVSVPLARVEQVWHTPTAPGRRIVLTP